MLYKLKNIYLFLLNNLKKINHWFSMYLRQVIKKKKLPEKKKIIFPLRMLFIFYSRKNSFESWLKKKLNFFCK